MQGHQMLLPNVVKAPALIDAPDDYGQYPSVHDENLEYVCPHDSFETSNGGVECRTYAQQEHASPPRQGCHRRQGDGWGIHNDADIQDSLKSSLIGFIIKM